MRRPPSLFLRRGRALIETRFVHGRPVGIRAVTYAIGERRREARTLSAATQCTTAWRRKTMPMTCDRAEQIRKRVLANHGVFTVGKDVTVDEDREICAFWNRLPHGTSYYDAIARMAEGRHLPGVDPETCRPPASQGDR
jgi:hypothetical protein